MGAKRTKLVMYNMLYELLTLLQIKFCIRVLESKAAAKLFVVIRVVLKYITKTKR